MTNFRAHKNIRLLFEMIFDVKQSVFKEITEIIYTSGQCVHFQLISSAATGFTSLVQCGVVSALLINSVNNVFVCAIN
jgi:hypothetical protein